MREVITKTLRARLFIYYLVPIALLLTGSCWYFYSTAKKSLDHEMNMRLTLLGETLGNQIDPLQLKALEDLGSQANTYKLLQKKFSKIAQINGLSYIYMIDRQGLSLVDSRFGFDAGLQYVNLKLFEAQLKSAFSGQTVTENVYSADQGFVQKYAFVPIKVQDDYLAVIVLKADALFFASLDILRKSLSYFAAACLLMILLISAVISAGIVKPIEHLVRKSKEIGEGILTKPIKIKADGELQYLAQALEDMRQKIRQRDEERDMMLKGIAHEIKNPIGGIELYIDILSNSLETQNDQKSLKKISKEIDTLKKVVDEFLDFARGIVLDIQEHDMGDFLLRCSEMFEQEIKQKNIQMSIKSDAQKWSFDAYYLKRVLLNVIRNAIDAIEHSSGAIKLSYNVDKSGLHILVQDNGTGILKQNLKEIYKPFFTSKAKGMGLGLAFCKKIIEKHGGSIHIDSEYEQGSSVKINLPHYA